MSVIAMSNGSGTAAYSQVAIFHSVERLEDVVGSDGALGKECGARVRATKTSPKIVDNTSERVDDLAIADLVTAWRFDLFGESGDVVVVYDVAWARPAPEVLVTVAVESSRGARSS